MRDAPLTLVAHVAQLPVEVTRSDHDVLIFGLMPQLKADFLLTTGWAHITTAVEHSGACTCKLKTAFVVTNHRTRWCQARTHSRALL